jgi:hypothetical protein
MVLGGKEFTLPVLSVEKNVEWTDLFAQAIRAKLDALPEGANSLDDVAKLLARSGKDMLDLLLAYDRMGGEAWDKPTVLPSRSWIDRHATVWECYEALKKVTAAEFPFGNDLRMIVPDLVPLLLQAVTKGVARAGVTLATRRSSSSTPPSTDGPPDTSNGN